MIGGGTYMSIIFHIDVNSAFLSWTALEYLNNGSDVDLRTVPSIVGGDQEKDMVLYWQNLCPQKLTVSRLQNR